MNWNRFDFGSYGDKDGSGEETVYEHDVRAIRKLYGDSKSEFYDLESKANLKEKNLQREKIYMEMLKAQEVQ